MIRCSLLRTLREVAPRVLGENKRISNPNANVASRFSAFSSSMQLMKPAYYTTFFGWARVIGITAQIIDERNSRGGKGVPIYRPAYIAKDRTVRRT